MPLFLGLTPQANHLSPLRGLRPIGADRQIESKTPIGFGIVGAGIIPPGVESTNRPSGCHPEGGPQGPSRGICGEMGQHAFDLSIDPSIRFRLRPRGFAVTSRSLGITFVERWVINLPSAAGATDI
jgi:hypothetical protein